MVFRVCLAGFTTWGGRKAHKKVDGQDEQAALFIQLFTMCGVLYLLCDVLCVAVVAPLAPRQSRHMIIEGAAMAMQGAALGGLLTLGCGAGGELGRKFLKASTVRGGMGIGIASDGGGDLSGGRSTESKGPLEFLKKVKDFKRKVNVD